MYQEDKIMMKKGLAAFRSNIDAAFRSNINAENSIPSVSRRQDHDEEGVGCVKIKY